jgi:hypothetical protein
MDIQPLLPPTLDGVGEFDVEIFDVRTNTDNNAANVVGDVVGAITAEAEDTLPQSPIRLDPEEALTQCDKNRHVEDGIGRQLMQLKPIDKQKTPKKLVDWGRKTSDEVVNETDPIIDWRPWVALFLGELEGVLFLAESHLLQQVDVLGRDLGSLPLGASQIRCRHL